MKAKEVILQYLASPQSKSTVVDVLSRRPYEAFQAILGFRGPYPKNIHPIDVHEEYLGGLLEELLKRCPQLLIGPRRAKVPPRPFILIAAAIAANDPRFANTILSGLKDRSIDVKLASLHGITQCAFLRTPAVKRTLRDLLALKSIANDAFVRDRIQTAVDLIEDKSQGTRE
jgi:hypothetical protein